MNKSEKSRFSPKMFARMGCRVRRAFVAPQRGYASVSPGVNPGSVGPFQVFDRKAKALQKDRSAMHEDGKRSQTVDYVREEVADRMIERLLVGCPHYECNRRVDSVIGHQAQI